MLKNKEKRFHFAIVLRSYHAITASNFAGPKLHQYWSVAVNFCLKMQIIMLTNGYAIENHQEELDENRRALLWHGARSAIAAHTEPQLCRDMVFFNNSFVILSVLNISTSVQII